MIAAHNIGVNHSFFDSILQAVGDEKIVNAPTNIAIAGLHHVGPPGIGVFARWIKVAEGICETFHEEFTHFAAFFISEACVAAIAFRIFNVDFLMGDVDIAAQNDRFFCIQLC